MPLSKILILSFVLFLVACGSSSSTISAPMNFQFITNTNLPENFDIQGHRGARGLKPENTLPSFETALDLGVSTLELDLHYSADNVVIVWHDDEISQSKCVIGDEAPLISQLNLTQIISTRCNLNPDLDRFPIQDNSKSLLAGDNYQIITLENIFKFVKTYSESTLKTEAQRSNAMQIQFNIETKRKIDKPEGINDGFNGIDPGPFELEILRLIAQFNLQDRVIIQSFDKRSLNAIRSVNNSIRLAFLTNEDIPSPTELTRLNVNIWSPNYRDLSASLVNSAHDINLKVIPWTINDAHTMQTLIDMGVDGIITDRPDILLKLGQ